MIDGVRVPLVAYMVVGQPEDTGPVIDATDPNVKLPSFVRAIMNTPVARVEWCMKCLADVFGLALVTPAEDPLYSDEQVGEERKMIEALQADLDVSSVDRAKQVYARTMTAIKVGRGVQVPRPVLTVNP
ncbi:MAG: hypothetical protein WEA80_01905 [Gemmatimonadaceae bacterium]